MAAVRIISCSSEPFRSREEAGEQLAGWLSRLSNRRPVMLGIPRGGIIVAHQAALRLKADLDVVLSHKLGAPYNPELAIGAVFEDGTHFVNKMMAAYTGADEDYIRREKAVQLDRITERARQYRKVLPKVSLSGRLVLVTDDGVATGASMQAALWAIRKQNPSRVVLALPVGPEDAVRKLGEHADETVCLKTPPDFQALSRFYLQFGQVDDEQVLEILKKERVRKSER